MVDHYAQKRGIVVTLAPQKVPKMVPKWSRFPIFRILLILKPLSIDSSVFEGLRDSLFPLCSCFFLTPFSDLYVLCVSAKKLNFGVQNGPNWGHEGGGRIMKLARRGPKDAKRKPKEVLKRSKEASYLQNCSKFMFF